MRRRALLASVPAALTALAGCQSPSAPETTETFRYTTVSDRELTFDPAPVRAPGIDWTVEKLSPATDRDPCRVRVAIENCDRERVISAAGELPYPIVRSFPVGHDPGSIRPVLLPLGSDYDRRFDGNCWLAPLQDPDLADDEPWGWGGRHETHTRKLAPGERVEGTYHLVSSNPVTCFPRGDHRFPRGYELDGVGHQWAFSVQVPTVDRDG